jgi:transposase
MALYPPCFQRYIGYRALISFYRKESTLPVNALKVSRTTIVRVRKRYCEDGLVFALTEKPRSGAPPKIDARVEAKLTALACSNPPEGRSRWTMNLLADKLVELGEVDSISGMSVCRALKKMR